MKSTSTSLIFAFIAFFLSFVSAAPLEVAARDVYAPPVLAPNATSVWKIGSTQTVIWNVSNPPAQITNPRASIILVKNHLLDLYNPLATDLDILAGSAEITVPSFPANETGHIFQIIVFGDSGNSGEVFTIEP